MKEKEIPKIDISLISEADARLLAATLLKAVKRFYSDPANMERFKAWEQEQAQESNEKSAG